MPEKMVVLFNPEKDGKKELQRVYERIFEIRRERPEDFIWSAFFSTFADAEADKVKVFIIKGKHGQTGKRFVDFERV